MQNEVAFSWTGKLAAKSFTPLAQEFHDTGINANKKLHNVVWRPKSKLCSKDFISDAVLGYLRHLISMGSNLAHGLVQTTKFKINELSRQ